MSPTATGADMFDLVVEHWRALLSGANTTFAISGTAWLTGLGLGVALAVTVELAGDLLRRVLDLVSLLVSSVPVLVLLLWAHYPLQTLLGVVVSPLLTTIVVLCLVNAIGSWKLLESARERVPRELIEACRLCGMSRLTTLRYVTGPAALRLALGGLMMLQISILHMSIFGSVISVPETLRIVQQINALEYRPVALYTILALFFLVLSLPVFLVARRVNGAR